MTKDLFRLNLGQKHKTIIIIINEKFPKRCSVKSEKKALIKRNIDASIL